MLSMVVSGAIEMKQYILSMPMRFAVGNKVRLLDEPGEGIVTAISGDEIMVEIDGMELPFEESQLVIVEHDELISDHVHSKPVSAKDRELRKKGREKLSDLETQASATYELDLHIHELLDHYSHMSNGEILQYQMQRCRSFVREAIDKRYSKIILIHGVGEGVLKQEIHHYLDQLGRVEYHDAPYRTYGYGATEVIIRG